MLNDPINMALRRYAGMAVTNLTFGDVANKVQNHCPAWISGNAKGIIKI